MIAGSASIALLADIASSAVQAKSKRHDLTGWECGLLSQWIAFNGSHLHSERLAMLNIHEDLLPVAEALAKRLPKVPHPATYSRWRTRGVNGVKLHAVRCGREWMTTLKAVDEFIRLQSEGT